MTGEDGRSFGTLLKFLGKLAKNAVQLETKTDAGRVNSFGMFLAVALVLVLALIGGLQGLAALIGSWISGSTMPEMIDIAQLLLIFLGFTTLCVAMLGTLVIAARRGDGRTRRSD